MYSEKLVQEFAELVEKHQRETVMKSCPNFTEVLLKQSTKVTVEVRQKYTLVNVGDSGRYMVEKSTGKIYGIKGYGSIHRGHRYGNLETINKYYWGNYTAVLRKCTRCKGNGMYRPEGFSEMTTCTQCNGTGKYTD